MILAVFAPLLLVVSAQSPPSDYGPGEAEAYPQEQPADDAVQAYPEDGPSNGDEDDDGVEPAPAEEVEDPDDGVVDSSDEAADDSAEQAEEEEEMVCRRVHYIDDFGRQRSRKSCTPR